MNYQAIYQEVIDIRFNSQTTKLLQVKKWVGQAEIALWNAANWVFKYVAPTNLAIVAGDNTPAMPADFGKVDGELYDYLGVPLKYHGRREFSRLFQEDIARATTGEPTDFTIVNRQIYLAPIPAASRTYVLPYVRRYTHLNSGGIATAGVMSADTDTPIWDSEHHYILVPWAIRLGKYLEDDPTATMLEQVIEGLKTTSLFQAMVEELVDPQVGALQQWGGDAALWSDS